MKTMKTNKTKTIYQLYINCIASKHIFNTEAEAIELKNKISILYKKVTINKIIVPVK
jgi:hypothetical protein